MELTWVEALGHIAYTLIFFSFLVKRVLYLRCLAILASICSICYNSFIVEEALWVPIAWNVLFVAVNSRHIALLLWEKRKITFSGDALFLYEEKFSHLPPVEFQNLMDLSYTRSVGKGEVLMEEGIKNPALLIILEGGAGVFLNGKEIASLEKGEFVGEMSFLTNELTSARVISKSRIRILFWEHDALLDHLMKNPSLMRMFEASLSRQVIDKLRGAVVMQDTDEVAPLKAA